MGTSLKLWKNLNINKNYEKAYLKVDDFFEDLYHHSNDDTISTNSINVNKLTYREGQNRYALDIMETIKNKDILLIQAGVGIGKSFGYLLPIFYTYDNVQTFKKIIISTSSIALQEQLLKDIQTVSSMLKIEIKADIAKGINNYACLQRIYKRISSDFTTEEDSAILSTIAAQIEKIESSDKSDLDNINEKTWEAIQLQSRGYCSSCSYSRLCPFYKKQKTINANGIIITNHANMVKNILDNSDLVKDVDMIVFDEAHKLEENIQNIRTYEIKLQNIIYQIEQIGAILTHKYQDNNISSLELGENELEEFILRLKFDIEGLFSAIRSSASRNFFDMKKKTNNEEDYSITDANRLAFKITPTLTNILEKTLKDLKQLFNQITIYEVQTRTNLRIKEVDSLKSIYLLFKDMLKKEASNNIYWANFYKNNKISLIYTPKDSLNINKSIFLREIPIICTSGTMLDNAESYYYFSEGLGLNQLTNRTITYGDEQKSPYDYDHNSLFYYNPDLPNPNDKNNYIIKLTLEISELIRMTNGKALILFTSKETMKKVYNLLSAEKFPFKILLHTDNNTNEIKECFAKDTNSCLLATGAFWEGIDVKGKALSNLIITHLPFDQVDAVTQYKASKYSKEDQFREVYFPNMLTKFRQAIGRLIRSDDDTGIVCCLDSRFANYQKIMQSSIPMTNYTTDKKELYQFAETKILDQSEIDTLIKIKK